MPLTDTAIRNAKPGETSPRDLSETSSRKPFRVI